MQTQQPIMCLNDGHEIAQQTAHTDSAWHQNIHLHRTALGDT